MSARPPRLRMYLKQPHFSYLHVHHGAGSRGGPGSRGGHGHLHILSRGPRAGHSVFIYGDEEPSARAPGTPDARQAPAVENTGVMVAYYPPMETARRLAIPGYETAGDLHMTVLYLGKAGGFPFEKREKLRAAVAAFAAGEQPIGARISELRRFPPSESSDGKDVWYAAVHSEHLHDLRARLKAALAEAGITVEDTHPHYTPHITLAYCAPGEEQPVSRIPALDMPMGELTVVIADRHNTYPLGGMAKSAAQPGAWELLKAKMRLTPPGITPLFHLPKEPHLPTGGASGAGSRGGPGSQGGQGHVRIITRGPREGQMAFMYGDDPEGHTPAAPEPQVPDHRRTTSRQSVVDQHVAGLKDLQPGDHVPSHLYISDYKDGGTPPWRVRHRADEGDTTTLHVEDPTNAHPQHGAVSHMVVVQPNRVLIDQAHYANDTGGPDKLADLGQHAEKGLAKRARRARQPAGAGLFDQPAPRAEKQHVVQPMLPMHAPEPEGGAGSGWAMHPHHRNWYTTYIEHHETPTQRHERQLLQGPPRDEAAPCARCGLLSTTPLCVFCAIDQMTQEPEAAQESAHAPGEPTEAAVDKVLPDIVRRVAHDWASTAQSLKDAEDDPSHVHSDIINEVMHQLGLAEEWRGSRQLYDYTADASGEAVDRARTLRAERTREAAEDAKAKTGEAKYKAAYDANTERWHVENTQGGYRVGGFADKGYPNEPDARASANRLNARAAEDAAKADKIQQNARAALAAMSEDTTAPEAPEAAPDEDEDEDEAASDVPPQVRAFQVAMNALIPEDRRIVHNMINVRIPDLKHLREARERLRTNLAAGKPITFRGARVRPSVAQAAVLGLAVAITRERASVNASLHKHGMRPLEPEPDDAPVTPTLPSKAAGPSPEAQAALEADSARAAAKTTAEAAPRKIVATAEDLDYDTAMRAHSGTSMVPERRADQERQGTAQHLQSVYDDLSKRARSDAQRQILDDEFARYKAHYIQQYEGILGRRSRIYSSMIAGPSRFPGQRMAKLNDADRKRTDEFIDWEKRAITAMKRAIEGGRTPEEAGEASARALGADVTNSLRAIHEIDTDTGGMRGFNRTAFVNSIAGRTRTAAQNGNVVAVARAINLVTAYNKEHPKAAITPTHSFWGLLEEALRNKQKADLTPAPEPGEAADAEESAPAPDAGNLGAYTGARAFTNRGIDRVQIVFEGRPDEETRAALRGAGWNWSPTNGAWQRKATLNAEASARAIMGQREHKMQMGKSRWGLRAYLGDLLRKARGRSAPGGMAGGLFGGEAPAPTAGQGSLFQLPKLPKMGQGTPAAGEGPGSRGGQGHVRKIERGPRTGQMAFMYGDDPTPHVPRQQGTIVPTLHSGAEAPPIAPPTPPSPPAPPALPTHEERASDPSTPSRDLEQLANHSNVDVRRAALSNPSTQAHVLHAHATDADEVTRQHIAEHPNTHPDTLAALRDDKAAHIAQAAETNPSTLDGRAALAYHDKAVRRIYSDIDAIVKRPNRQSKGWQDARIFLDNEVNKRLTPAQRADIRRTMGLNLPPPNMGLPNPAQPTPKEPAGPPQSGPNLFGETPEEKAPPEEPTAPPARPIPAHAFKPLPGPRPVAEMPGGDADLHALTGSKEGIDSLRRLAGAADNGMLSPSNKKALADFGKHLTWAREVAHTKGKGDTYGHLSRLKEDLDGPVGEMLRGAQRAIAKRAGARPTLPSSAGSVPAPTAEQPVTAGFDQGLTQKVQGDQARWHEQAARTAEANRATLPSSAPAPVEKAPDYAGMVDTAAGHAYLRRQLEHVAHGGSGLRPEDQFTPMERARANTALGVLRQLRDSEGRLNPSMGKASQQAIAKAVVKVAPYLERQRLKGDGPAPEQTPAPQAPAPKQGVRLDGPGPDPDDKVYADGGIQYRPDQRATRQDALRIGSTGFKGQLDTLVSLTETAMEKIHGLTPQQSRDLHDFHDKLTSAQGMHKIGYTQQRDDFTGRANLLHLSAGTKSDVAHILKQAEKLHGAIKTYAPPVSKRPEDMTPDEYADMRFNARSPELEKDLHETRHRLAAAELEDHAHNAAVYGRSLEKLEQEKAARDADPEAIKEGHREEHRHMTAMFAANPVDYNTEEEAPSSDEGDEGEPEDTRPAHEREGTPEHDQHIQLRAAIRNYASRVERLERQAARDQKAGRPVSTRTKEELHMVRDQLKATQHAHVTMTGKPYRPTARELHPMLGNATAKSQASLHTYLATMAGGRR